MGCAQSVAVKMAESQGIQLTVPGETGKFAPHSEKSFGCLSVVVGKESVEGFAKGSLDAEFQDDMTTRRQTSTKIKTTLPGGGVKREDKGVLRASWEGDMISLKTLKDNLDGLDISLGPTNKFELMLCTYMPLNAPCGLYKESAKVSKSGGGLSAKPIVIQPGCRLVDLYMRVDGKAYEDTKFCNGEGSNDNSTAMEEALKRCYGAHEEPLKRQINGGPPKGEQKPWVTLFSKGSFESENFVYLPLAIPQGGDADAVMLDEAKEYAAGLLQAWSKLLGEVGAGKHAFELRISPRCVINPVPGEGEGYKEGLALIEGYGKISGLNTDGDPGTILRENIDAKFTEYCQEWEGQDLIPDPTNPIFKANFSLDLDAAICTGKGPERLVEEFDKNFRDDVEEYCQIAYDLAGSSSGPARKAFGCSPSKPAHIVLVERADSASNPSEGKDDKEGHEYRAFLANAYWLHPDGGDDDEGVHTLMYDRHTISISSPPTIHSCCH